ncbi:hypothetical protein OAR30_03450 [Euryarchaeota archaeon]|nr:hypothetical protein [Euryarchaeota archaeon]MDC1029630.1 hypothetical protein [Euryarchaeota archaeon]
MVEIECPLCAESIDLGMAEEGEYECPYCEDVFHWEPDEFQDIKNLQCPKGCGQLSYASFNRSILNTGGLIDRLKTDKIGYYECKKCKGSLLNANNIGAILEANSDKVRTLESLLEEGVSCDLDCPTCEGKMVEINVYYEPSNPMEGTAGGGSDLVDLAIMLVIGIPLIAYEASKHNYEGGKATLILDGCGDCGSFWFDKGEIDKIRKSDDVDGMGI